jgi:hypothetical protein
LKQPFEGMLIMRMMGKKWTGRAGGLAAIAALAACSANSEPAGKVDVADNSSAAAMQSRLESLSESERDAVFLRAIRDAHRECQHVDRSERAGEHQGRPIWRAWCEGETSYTVVMTQSGTVQVLADAEVRLGHEAPPKEGGRGQ